MASLLQTLRAELGNETFDRYLGRTADLQFDDKGLHVTVQSRFAADMIDARFGPALRRAMAACGRSGDDPISFDVRPRRVGEGASSSVPTSHPHRVAPRKTSPRRRARSAGYTLDTFIVGHCNRLAFETARRLAEAAGPDVSSPFFLYGPCGVGKTHLLSAVAARYTEINPGARIKLVTAESFTNEYITAVRSNTVEAFHRVYRRIDLLCVDDIHYLAKKNGTQKELLHTFDTLDFGGSRVVLASDAHPRQIRQLSEGLISRFVSGSLARIDPPDPPTTRRLVRHFAVKAGLRFDDEAVRLLADLTPAGAPGAVHSVRDLLGMVNQVLAYTHLMAPDAGGEVDAAIALAATRHDEFRSPADSNEAAVFRPVPIDRIVDAVCRDLEVTRADLAGKGRHKGVVLARAMTALLAKRLTKRSYPEIAAAIGRRNHSTIITAHRRIERQMEQDETVEVGLHLDGMSIAVLASQIERALRSAS